MKHFDEKQINGIFDYKTFIPYLNQCFQQEVAVPERPHYNLPAESGDNGTLLLMPSWSKDDYMGVKIVSVFPDNPSKNLPSIQGIYLLMDRKTGTVLSTFDAATITKLRTAASSALASGFLSRQDCSTLLVMGTGTLAPEMARAHSSVRPIREIYIWGRSAEKAEILAKELTIPGIKIQAIEDHKEIIGQADIISTVTSSDTAIISGNEAVKGQHYDLVGSYTPQMREGDDLLIDRSSLFIDTFHALKESGDLSIPLSKGIISRSDILSDLSSLCEGHHLGRKDAKEITLFKSVGYALEDLAIAQYLYESENTADT